MRRSSRLALALTLVVSVAACGGDGTDDDTAAPADDTTETAATDDEGGEDAEEDEGSATATWDGETYEYDSASCRTSMSGERFQMLARGGDNPQLDVRFNLDGDDVDFSQPNSIELFFDRGETIGDGEGYEARGDATAGVSGTDTGVSGTIELEPDTETQAPDLNPEGGTLEFEIVCPA